MWVFLNNSFLSIVQPKDAKDGVRADKLLVRARFSKDITRVFPDADVTQTPERDYMYRALIDRELVANAMHEQAMNIDYGNFKDSVDERWRHDAYAAVWGVMYREQMRQDPFYDY